MKITRSHSSATESAKKVIKVLEKTGLVSKISLGIIKKTKSKSGNINMKFLPITGGFKAVIVGGGTVQELYIYTTETNEIKRILLDNF
jgi:hypothetical protein